MNLQLSLKKNWFEMTKAGIKTEDYREITCYWAKRLVHNLTDVLIARNSHVNSFISDEDAYQYLTNPRNNFGFKNFETNTMTLGYPKSTDTERILKIEHKGVEIRTGNPEWGAEEGKVYFVIKHGNIIKEYCDCTYPGVRGVSPPYCFMCNKAIEQEKKINQ